MEKQEKQKEAMRLEDYLHWYKCPHCLERFSVASPAVSERLLIGIKDAMYYSKGTGQPFDDNDADKIRGALIRAIKEAGVIDQAKRMQIENIDFGA